MKFGGLNAHRHKFLGKNKWRKIMAKKRSPFSRKNRWRKWQENNGEKCSKFSPIWQKWRENRGQKIDRKLQHGGNREIKW